MNLSKPQTLRGMLRWFFLGGPGPLSQLPAFGVSVNKHTAASCQYRYLLAEEIACVLFEELPGSASEFAFQHHNRCAVAAALHHSTGRNLRNRFGLWHKNYPLPEGLCPDGLSGRVLEMVWDKVHSNA